MKVVAAVILCAVSAFADQLSDTFDALKRAEAAKNAADVRVLAMEVSRLARIQIAQQAPPEARDEYQKERAVYLSQTDTYTEYSMAVAASFPNTSAATIEQLVDAIVAQNRQSDYLELAVPPYLASLAGNPVAQAAAAQRIVGIQPDNEDALLVLTETTLEAQKYDAAVRYAADLLAAVTSKAKPERYTEQAWKDKTAQLAAAAKFHTGRAACAQQQWKECDAQLRTVPALPMLAGPLNFYLGWANYQLAKSSGDRARMEEALRFSQQSAAIPGAAQASARQNVQAIQQELKR